MNASTLHRAFGAIAFAALIAAVSATGAQAQSQADRAAQAAASAAFAKCGAIAETNERLACYDASAPKVGAVLNGAPTVQVTPTTRDSESWFGLDLPSLFTGSKVQATTEAFGSDQIKSANREKANIPAAPPQVNRIASGVSNYAFDNYGIFTIFLDNGQVWRQVSGDNIKATFRRTAKNGVVISRGFWDSYNLKLNDSSARYKVIRIR